LPEQYGAGRCVWCSTAAIARATRVAFLGFLGRRDPHDLDGVAVGGISRLGVRVALAATPGYHLANHAYSIVEDESLQLRISDPLSEKRCGEFVEALLSQILCSRIVCGKDIMRLP
jgi:hypothetical protein